MSALRAQLVEDMKSALRAHETVRLAAIRYVLSEIKNFEIDNGEQDDAGVAKIIAREVKKTKDALVDFQKAGRDDLIAEEEAKIAIMEAYLPKQLADTDLKKIVETEVAQAEKKDFGSIMKAVIAQVQGQADGARVSTMVKQVLGS